uniref:Uncharacterized protein n=1 Tax=Mola mola TaxID=94237 RepID=A0A3Q3WI80_MOLML
MLEHSGTYHETAMHTGTFAQEIITLVHHVKEQYFRDSGVTLNQRFSAPQEGSYSEETEELTLDQRFTSNRYPVRGPGDLRHDLERRRQERLEGVRVTISGNSLSQRGASYQTLNSQRRNNRFGNRLGPMRRQNNYNNPAGNSTPLPHSGPPKATE